MNMGTDELDKFSLTVTHYPKPQNTCKVCLPQTFISLLLIALFRLIDDTERSCFYFL